MVDPGDTVADEGPVSTPKDSQSAQVPSKDAEVLPCPECGSAPAYDHKSYGVSLGCDDCGTRAAFVEGMDGALWRWTLIATAPELLVALKQLSESWCHVANMGRGATVPPYIQAVIAKAEGR